MNQPNNNSKETEFTVSKNLVVKSIAVEQKKQSVSLTIQLNTSPKPSKRRWRTYEFPLL
jgi:hypothetical protein